jgi:hypothetical protein
VDIISSGDESALLLQYMHEKVVDFGGFLHAYIDFDEAFELEEEGVIHLDRQKEKSTYKKFRIILILFNN